MERHSVVLMPYDYITKLGGKNFWLKTANVFNYWTQTHNDKFGLIMEAVTLLHNASLIIDDIEDRSVMRRGAKSAHEVFGVPMALNSANYAYFLALGKLQELKDFKIIEIFTKNMILLHEGQGCDISYRDSYIWSYKDSTEIVGQKVEFDQNQMTTGKDNFAWPTLLEYENVMAKKTSGLVKMTIEMLHMYTTKELEDVKYFSLLADRLGLCFQMWDDLMNITSQRFTDAKGFAADLDEGTFTFPIIYGLNQPPFGSKLLKMIQQKTKSRSDKEEIIALLNECGAIEYTRQRVHDLITEIRGIGDRFGDNPLMDEFLKQFFINFM